MNWKHFSGSVRSRLLEQLNEFFLFSHKNILNNSNYNQLRGLHNLYENLPMQYHSIQYPTLNNYDNSHYIFH